MKITLTSVRDNDPIQAFKFYTESLEFVEHTFIPEANMAIVVSPEEPTKTDWGMQAIFDDTCGNLIQISQM
jgi:hypothetical protein